MKECGHEETQDNCAQCLYQELTNLEETIVQSIAHVKSLEDENARLREALEKIANEENYGLAGDWGDKNKCVWDVAREALRQAEGGNDE